MTGPGTVKRLEKHGIHTMGEMAYFSTVNQDILYKEYTGFINDTGKELPTIIAFEDISEIGVNMT